MWSWAHVVVQLFGVIAPSDGHSQIELVDRVETAIEQPIADGNVVGYFLSCPAAEPESRLTSIHVVECVKRYMDAKVQYSLVRRRHRYCDVVDSKVEQDVVHLYALDVLRDDVLSKAQVGCI